jgi:hypothetical protein
MATKNETSIKNKSEDMMTKEEVVEMLREMQQKVGKCHGFITGHVSQAWVVKDLLGEKIKELGGGDTILEVQ